jgi:hypothetical protein
VSFAINAPLGRQSPWEFSYYSFYFDALHLYFVNHWISMICLIVGIGVWIFYRKSQKVLFTGLLFVLPFLLMTLNQNKQERFLFTFVFALWILVSYGIARISIVWIRAGAAFSLCALSYFLINPAVLQDTIAWPFVPEEVKAPIQFIVDQTKDSKEIRVIGATNQMSPSLIAYHVRKATAFENDPNFEWRSEKPVRSRTVVVGINTPIQGTVVSEKSFPGEIRIQIMKPNADRN